MHILLIGGTGVLSTAITSEALNKNIQVTMINRGTRKNIYESKVKQIKTDKDNYKLIKEQLQGLYFDAVIDFLCYTEIQIENSFNFYSNYTKQYFFISSCAVYNTSVGGIMEENSPKVLPIWEYSKQKWNSEKLLVSLAKKTNTKYTIIRPCITYGDTRIPYGISPKYGFHWTLIARILNGKPIIRWNKGINRCNMTHVDDFAVGVIGLIGNPKAYNEVFNVCGEETPSFNDVLEAIEEIIKCPIKTIDIDSSFYAEEIPNRKGEILGGRSIDAINSNKKLKNLIPSFKQTINLKEGIKRTIKAYKNRNYQNGIDWKFDADTDRIITKWCKINHIKYEKLQFIDYLNNATVSQRITYFIERNKKNYIIKTLIETYHVSKRTILFLKRLKKKF